MRKIVFGTAVVCALLGAPVWAASLKVTSFPDGASITIDGVPTGKVTPAQISVIEGTHQVDVAIAGSEWDPVTTTILVSTGNNDLSVTLLPHVLQGPPGQSVTSASLLPGDLSCPYGGSRFTSASGDTYACNGAPGAPGAPGETGPPGPAGTSLPDCPSSTNIGPTCGESEDVGVIGWGGATSRFTALPARGSGDHWYRVRWSASGSPPDAAYHPHVYLSTGLTQYVFDVFLSCSSVASLACSPIEPSFGTWNWELVSTGILTDVCVPPSVSVFVRVRPIGLNLRCEPYAIVFQNG